MSARDYQLALQALNKLAIDKSLDSVTSNGSKSTATHDCASPDDSSMEPFSPETPFPETPYPETPSTIDDMDDKKDADKIAELTVKIASLKAEVRDLTGQRNVRDVEIAALKDDKKSHGRKKVSKITQDDWKIRPSHYPGVDFEFYKEGNPIVKIRTTPKRPVLPHEWDQKPSPK